MYTLAGVARVKPRNGNNNGLRSDAHCGLTLSVITHNLHTMPTSLRDEIKQTKPFKSLVQEAQLNLERTAAVLFHRFANTFKAFDITPTQHDDAWWFLARIKGNARDDVIRLVAIEIVHRLCEPSVAASRNWMARHNGGAPHDDATKAELEAYLLADFADPLNETRLQGAVVEHLWACLADGLDGGWGKPLYVEHEHFSVIDHGGDGLSIYEFAAPDLRFRLWESKRHDSTTTSVTTVVTGAAAQLKKDAASYLARMSKPLQLADDPRIQQLAGTIVKLWTTRDGRSGVGVAVGTTKTVLPARPFKGLRDQFVYFAGAAHREGLVIEINDLKAFADGVRGVILGGIE